MNNFLGSDHIFELTENGLDIQSAIKKSKEQYLEEISNDLLMKSYITNRYTEFIDSLELDDKGEYSYIKDETLKYIFVLRNDDVIVVTPFVEISDIGISTGWEGTSDKGVPYNWSMDGMSYTSNWYDVVASIEYSKNIMQLYCTK